MKETLKAKIKDGKAVCPKCGALLCKLYYGAYADGVELWCSSKRCKCPILLNLSGNAS